VKQIAGGKLWGMVMRKPGDFLVRCGFVAVLVLILAAGGLIDAYKQPVRQRFGPNLAAIEATEKELSAIRRFLAQGFVAARDFLINNHFNASEAYAQDLRKAKAGMTGAVASLRGSVNPELLKEFQKDADDYWSALDQVRSFNAQQKAESGYEFVREDVFAARNTAQASLKDISDATAHDRAAVMAGYNQRRETLLTWFYADLGACAGVCLLLAWASLSYRSHLQRESFVKYDEVARARDDLEHLSGKLLKVQEEERRRLSRELHDGIGQTLTALRMEIHQAHMNAPTGTAGSERLMRARMLAEEAVHTIKDISLLLRPPLLDDLGLEPAIAWQTDQFTRRTGIPCRFRATGLQEMLPDDVKTCVFRVIQEALNNCQKHASPTKVQILIEQRTETLSVQVEDDGAGFVLNEKHVRHSGLGILGMRERASMLGGSVAIQSAPGKGTRLALSLPLAKMTATVSHQLDPPTSVPAIGSGERSA
jgi:signal transduction histidine kinase